jgi:ATP adenylyltransferase
MAEQLWAPWRLQYVQRDGDDSGCVFCMKQDRPDDETYVVARGTHCYAVLNLYPYNSGHLLVVPYRHVADLTELTNDESAECQVLLQQGLAALRATSNPDGCNIGLNLGSAAGAGVAAHLHWHIVPRWSGDTNFMPVVGDIKVMPQLMTDTWQQLRDAWPTSEGTLPT